MIVAGGDSDVDIICLQTPITPIIVAYSITTSAIFWAIGLAEKTSESVFQIAISPTGDFVISSTYFPNNPNNIQVFNSSNGNLLISKRYTGNAQTL